MKLSIRTKFAVGMVFIFVIILVLLVFSGFYLNRLSNKTSAILKENYLSVVYAREMSVGLLAINQEITGSFLAQREPDQGLIRKELDGVANSFQLEKSNITEPGEDKLVAGLENGINEYRGEVLQVLESPKNPARIVDLQKKFGNLNQLLVTLSQMNGKAIENKTDDAKLSSKNALTGMTILGTFCFLIALSFMYSFASYFNERFFQLYNGIKEIVSSNYGQRLYFDGVDEFYEISLVFNQMAEKLTETHREKSISLWDDSEEGNVEDKRDEDIQEMKSILARLKNIEQQANEMLAKLENKE